ncbi:MAG: hypothetical protein IT463_09720 [Planctomycetes bacterium]|nr:hypothetical protein [Planctomycetota bacterium]
MQALLQFPRLCYATALSGGTPVRASLRLMAAGVVGAACWGAAMGIHVGGVHLLLTALKMPLFFAATLALCFALMHVLALAGGVRARPAQTLQVALSGLSVTSTVLGAFSPVLALFAACAPIPSNASYVNLYVFCTACGAAAGLAGARHLAMGLRALHGSTPRAVLAGWLLIYQFTGAQMAWVLRPWIGSSYGVEGYYSLSRGLTGNFYVGVGRVLLRWMQQWT